MDAHITFQPQHDATMARLAEVARQTKLLKRIEARIPAGEKVLFTGLYTENGFMNCFFVLPTIILGLAGIVVLAGFPDAAGSSILLVATATASIIGAWQVKRRFPALNCFSIVVLTDKAVHVCSCSQGHNISEIYKRSTSWQDVKALVVERGARETRNCKTVTRLLLRYDHDARWGVAFRFAAEPATFKRVVGSILHGTTPVALASRQYRERISCGDEIDAGKVCDRVKPWLLPGWNRKAIGLLASLAVTFVAIAFLSEQRLAVLGVGSVFSPEVVATAIFFATFGSFTSLDIAVQMTCDVLAFMVAAKRCKPRPGSTIEARDEGIAWIGAAGPVFMPYAEAMVIEPRWLGKKRGLVVVTTREPGSREVRLGPVADPWALYYAISEKLDAWLAGRGYFIDLATLREMTTSGGGIESSIAAIVQSSAPGADPPELKIKKKATVDTVATMKTMPVPQARPLAYFTTILNLSPAYYADFLDMGEQVHLASRATLYSGTSVKIEVVATTKRLLVTSLKGTGTRWLSYARISHLTVAIKGWFAIKHARITIHVKPRERSRTEVITSPYYAPYEVRGNVELRRVRLDSPLVALLAGLAGVPVLPK